MRIIEGKNFTDERSLFKEKNLEIVNCSFDIGESPLKESMNISAKKCKFLYKYPFWYSFDVTISDCVFEEMSRSAIWYSSKMLIKNTIFNAPKFFRRAKDITIIDSTFSNGDETFWQSENINVRKTKFKGNYIFKNCRNIVIEDVTIDGNYSFDGSKNIVVKNCILNSKDAFWNTENVVVENSVINGEYIGWNSKDLLFKNCKITSHQGFCYIDGLTLLNCEINESDLIFEYCKNINADVKGHIISILNPTSGSIIYEECDEIILNQYHENEGIVIKKR